MNENRTPPFWPWIVVLLVALPVFYLGSFGPAVWLMRNEWISLESLCTAYQPVGLFYGHLPPILRSALIGCWRCGGASDIELFFLLSPGQGASY